jgi:hypothetical protein
MRNRFILLLFFISCGLFLFEFIFTSSINRLAADDLFFIQSVKDNGIFNGSVFQYSDQNSRFVSVLFIHFLIKLTLSSDLFFLFFGILLIASMSIAVFLLLRATECRYQANFRNMPLLSLFICSILFYSTLNAGEVWFWISSIPTYLFNTIIIIAGASLLFHKSRRWYVIVGGIFCFAYAGNASELSLAIILTLSVLFFLSVQSGLYKSDKLKTTIFLISFSVAFLFLLGGQGLSNRMDYSPSLPLKLALLPTVKYCGIILLKKIPLVIIPALCGIVFLAIKLSEQNFIPFRKHRLFIFTIVSALFIFLYQLMFTLQTGDVAPARALFPVMVLFIFSASVILAPSMRKINTNKLQIVVLIIFILFQTTHTIIFLPKTLRYVKQYDERMLLLSNNNSTSNKVVTLTKLPHSGLLYSAEISNDTSHYSNIHLKNSLQLNYHIKIE